MRKPQKPFVSRCPRHAAWSGLRALIGQIDEDIGRLKDQNAEDAVRALETEQVTLEHRRTLNKQMAEIERFVENLRWLVAADTAKRTLTTRPLTEKETELFRRVIADEYRLHLADECETLKSRLPIEFQTQGQRGETLRSLLVRGGHKPRDILSEGEQRAVALADFLTEVSLNPVNAGIVLDDPVTSQDHERKHLIARRLVAEASQRQVVIFTHDLVFLTMLADEASSQDVEILTHWIERDADDRPGQISLDDSPTTTPQYRNTQKAKRTLDDARAAVGSERERLIGQGMAELRRTVEEMVPRHVLKQVVNRWSDRVMVTSLKKINWDDTLVADIITTFEGLSGFIEGHSRTEERAEAPPVLRQLEEMIDKVDNLIKRAKRERGS